MSIEHFINSKTQQKAETEAVTVRLPLGTVAAIDEFSLTLGVTRQEVIAEFVADSLSRALTHYEEMKNKPDLLEPMVSAGDGTSKRYFVLNTNRSNNDEDHFKMVTEGLAAAFTVGWKHKIDVLREGDTVFLYESKVGIVGIGQATGKTEVLDYYEQIDGTHQQVLTDYKRVAPLNAREIKKITGSNMRFLHTMFNISSRDGELLEKHISIIN
jgi:hypothetical protein